MAKLFNVTRSAKACCIGMVVAFAAAFTFALPESQRLHAQTAAAEAPQVPDPYKLNMLIRTTLIALNQANRTGNYTVLRDLAAPAFQRTNNAARLAEIFAKLRKRDLNLSPILFFQPKLQGPANLTDNGLLRLTGYFETKPEQISFDMLFQPVENDWRLFGLAVDVARPQASAQERQPEQGTQEQTQAEPGATQNSAAVQPSQQSADRAPQPAFVPQKVVIPSPDRRPRQEARASSRSVAEGSRETRTSEDSNTSVWPTLTEQPSEQPGPDTAEAEADEDSGGSSWSLWGN